MSWEAQAWVWNLKLKAGPKWVLMGIANYADQDSKCWPSLDVLMVKLGLTKPAVIANIKILEKMGLVQKTREHHYGNNVYQLKTGKESLPDQVKNLKLKQVKNFNPILSENPIIKPKEEETYATPSKMKEFIKAWNDGFKGELPSVTWPLSEARRRKLISRLREHPDDDYWSEVFNRIGRSKFLLGQVGKDWRCTFDWLMGNETNCMKIMEGHYDTREENKGQGRQRGGRGMQRRQVVELQENHRSGNGVRQARQRQSQDVPKVSDILGMPGVLPER